MQLLIVLRVFALILFLFLPSIAVMLFMAFVVRDTGYFIGFGLITLIGNGLVLFVPIIKNAIGAHLNAIARPR
jgi:hypothetical protein